MEKVALSFKELEPIKVDFKGAEIFIIPYIDINTEIELISAYVQAYFKPVGAMVASSKYDYLGAEYTMIVAILDKLTNVKILEDNQLTLSIKDIVYFGLWDLVKSKVVNYSEFQQHLQKIVNDIKEQMQLEQSVGKVINDVSVSLTDMFNKMADMNMEEFLKTAIQIRDEIKKSPIEPLLKEAAKEETNKRKSKKNEKEL